MDKEIYFNKSFNEQMAWIGEEVEHIIIHECASTIRAQGKDSYGMLGSTYAIKRLFNIIRLDPKNLEHLNELNKAEKELIEFLYNDKNYLSERKIYKYWHDYLDRYIDELIVGENK